MGMIEKTAKNGILVAVSVSIALVAQIKILNQSMGPITFFLMAAILGFLKIFLKV